MSVLANAVRLKNPVLSSTEAARFMRQICLCNTLSEITSAAGQRATAIWNTQTAIPAQESVYTMSVNRGPSGYPDTWDQFANARWGAFDQKWYVQPDKLRNRIAYALCDFFVISGTTGGWSDHRQAVGNFYDILYNNVYGNFRTLLEQVSRSPEMSLYLTHFRNEKADPISGRMPDENYAREIMQLFTIGLWELNDDGSRRKNGQLEVTDPRYVLNGTDDVPTYGQDDITNLARVFTGMCFPNLSNQPDWGITNPALFDESPFDGWRSQLVFHPSYHENTLPKIALNGRINIPIGTGGDASLTAALDALFNHPCTPPFFCNRMIRLLITSNPSPQYISRVVSVFKNNGSGVRGDLGAVFKAIFLDQEARAPSSKGLISKPADFFHHGITLTGMFGPLANDTNGAFTAGGGGSYPGSRTSGYGRRGWWEYYQNSGFNRAGSVFGRFPAVFTPPNSFVAQAGRIAPEMFHYEEGGTDALYTMNQGQIEAIRNIAMTSEDYTDIGANATTRTAFVNRYSLLMTAGTAPQSYIDSIVEWIGGSSSRYTTDSQKRETFGTVIWTLWISPWGLVRT